MRPGRLPLFAFFTQFRRPGHAALVVLLSLLTALLALGPTVRPAQAQSAADDSAQTEDSTEARRFRLAESYLQAGQNERAIALLEDLYAEHPGTHAFYVKLKEAYEGVKQYDDAIALVEDRIDRNPLPVRFSEKAQLLYLKGDEAAAFETWDEAIAAAPDQHATYQVVYHALVEARRFERAIDVIERGRERLGTPDAFRTEIAYLHNLTGQHEEAIAEYLALLGENERRLGFIRSRLAPFIEQDDALAVSIEVTKERAREAPNNLAYREMLAWLHMEAEQYREAFDVYRAIDRLQQENGRRLLAFARQTADARAYDVALAAYEELLTRYPDAPIAPDVQHSLGNMHRRWAQTTGERVFDKDGNRTSAPHYEAAREAYRAYLEAYPNREAYPQVLHKLGRLQQDVFRQWDDAEATLQQVVDRHPDTDAAHEARYDLARLVLLRGDLSAARLAFSRLVERLRTGDLAEQARYELALIHFYRGEFETALSQVKSTQTNTSTDVANDAITLKMLITQHRGPDSLNTPLRQYAEARLFERQRRYDRALASIDTLLARHGQHAIAAEAHFLRAGVLSKQGQAEQAAAAFANLPEAFPQSTRADQSLFRAAQLQEQALDDDASAIGTYRRLLENYPGSLLTTKARTRIRALQRRVSS